MSATTRAAVATFAGVGVIFSGAVFAAGSAMAASGQQPTDEGGASNMCPPAQGLSYATGKCTYGAAGQGLMYGPWGSGTGGDGY